MNRLRILLYGANDSVRNAFAAACEQDGVCSLAPQTDISVPSEADAVIVYHAIHEEEKDLLAQTKPVTLYIAAQELPETALCFWAQDVICGEPDWANVLFRIKRLCGWDVAKPLQLHEKIKYVLRELSVPEKQLGFMYIQCAIEVLLAADNAPLNLSQDIYPALARAGASTPRMAEKCVIHSIGCAWKDCDVSIQHAFFGYSREERPEAPTNAAFLFAVAERIRLSLLHVK